MVDHDGHDHAYRSLPSPDSALEVTLSRPEYRLGSPVVGTIRLLSPSLDQEPRSYFTAAEVRVVGRCRIDSRWHNPAACKRLYGKHPYLDEAIDDQLRIENDVTIWATNVVNLLELSEREVGKWRHVKPGPLHLPPEQPELYFTEPFGSLSVNGGTDHADEGYPDSDYLERRQLCFTFRADLPLELPPTSSFFCCRYFYSVVAYAKTMDGRSLLQAIPFHLTSTQHNHLGQEVEQRQSVSRLGSCQAMAHSAGLPCHLTADEILSPEGQTSIRRMPKRDAKTLRVADPQGRPCCILTAFGSSFVMPGGQILLQFDFLAAEGAVECHQISACLEGQEFAIHQGRRSRTRTMLLATDHEYVEPDATESLALSLQVPLDCPVTMETDFVELVVRCLIDVSVESNTSRSGYTNLRLDLPVTVVHRVDDDIVDDDVDDEDEPTVATSMDQLLSEQLHLPGQQRDPTDPASFHTKDILRELKILSLVLANRCNLTEGYK